MIYIYDDPSKWGREVAMAAGRAGIPITFFTAPQEVPEGTVAFVRLDQYKERRNMSKVMVENLTRKGVHVLPNLQDARLYDDKCAQYEKLSQFMPDTHIVYRESIANGLIPRLTFPIVSKAAEGANAANVRLLRDAHSARREVQEVFHGKGLKMTYQRWQRGYVLWQRFVEGNPHDYRIIIVGDYGRGLVRQNRKDVPFASGSGVNRPLTLETEDERKVYDLAWRVKDHLGTDMIGLDIVLDKGTPLLLETTSSWTIGPWVTAPVFDRAGSKTQYTMGWQWDLIVLVLKRMLEKTNGVAASRHGVAQQ